MWYKGNSMVKKKKNIYIYIYIYQTQTFLTFSISLSLSLSLSLSSFLLSSKVQPLPVRQSQIPTPKIKSSLFFYKNNKRFCNTIMIFVGEIPFSSFSSFSLVHPSLFPFFFFLFFFFELIPSCLFDSHFFKYPFAQLFNNNPSNCFFPHSLIYLVAKKNWKRKKKNWFCLFLRNKTIKIFKNKNNKLSEF